MPTTSTTTADVTAGTDSLPSVRVGRPCAAGCGTVVPPGRGRARNRPWYCGSPACLKIRDRRISEARRRRAGISRRRDGTCLLCGQSYRGSSSLDDHATGVCNRATCLAHKRRLRARAQQWAYGELAARHPEEWRQLLGMATARVFKELAAGRRRVRTHHTTQAA